jgi:hypothetical protein
MRRVIRNPIAPRRASRAALVVASLAAVAGCGSSSDPSATGTAPSPSSFPAVSGRSLDQILASEDHQNVAISPTGAVFGTGKNRFGFGIFQVDNTPIANAQVALYAQPLDGGPTVGPFTASYQTLATDSKYQSDTTRTDPDAAKGFYVATVPFNRPGNWNMVALMRQGDKLTAARVNTSIAVGRFKDIPEVGDKPPDIHTPTSADVGGDLGKIDTRQPHDDMHEVDFHDVIGKQPVVLVFATPALCQSRVCGPVVDVAEQVEHEPSSKGVAFIHQEVYNHNNASDGIRPQLQAFGLRTEPWLFVFDRSGRISTRVEGAFSVPELEAAVKKVAPSQ